MNRLHILIVDDEAMIRLTLDTLLRRRGYNVALAATGQQALACLAAHSVDLVLLDLFLPDVSGMDIAKFVSTSHPETAILLLTGSGALTDVEHSGYEYIEKTSDPQAVLARIATLLLVEAPALQ